MAESDFKNKIIVKIKWLRTQPENVKVRYIWISAFVIFAIVVMLWVGLFQKYERKAVNNGKSAELNEEIKKIKDDFGSKIKIPDIKLPEISPSVSPLVSPEATPEASSKASSKITPEAM